MRFRSRAVLAALVATTACGGDAAAPTAPPATRYETIAGSYAGVLAGISQGIALDATFALSLTQAQGTLGGSYSLTGTLTDGIDGIDVAGAGTLTGTIASGGNPSVNLTLRTPLCPSYSARFSGAYDTANRRLTITGPVEFFDANCAVVLSYVGTIILNR